jgi:two-component system response regulator (stage 0 sporulation protein F)
MKDLSVLIVDDDYQIRDLMKEIFSRLKWNAAAAQNGDEALKILREKKFDLLFTDRTMPGMLGEDLIWRAKLVRSGIKIIMMTGDGNFEEIQRKAMGAGADKVLRKPATLSEIENAVNNLFPEN